MPNWGEWVPLDGAPVTVERDPARDAARAELLNPAYHRHDPSLLERVKDWIFEQLDRAFGAVGLPSGGLTATVVFLLIAVLLAAALWWRFGLPRRAARTAATLFDSTGPATAADHRAAAAAHAAAAAWDDAVREQLRALIRGLEERTLLDVRPGRTADEAAAEAGRVLPEHADALRRAARTFDDVVYGEHAADQAAYHSLLELDRAVGAARPTLTGAAG
ncbi:MULTISPECIES: DUF4129 domain-containing protein [unclassified Kitasatospora]|uniref:DUF4129 domain-containing protein n=1 Tax=unclassified Kitasatospora TaxID=2633591 RepID=UPI00070BFB64|nr:MULTISPECIES: DUF4129 domain-containing protein [unclassified Kitasatospora]KQV12585.1 hypothetical protein ASC99_34115 [Kitasatospora sp. Root107]KRB67743.1 hypothetical protein ASE03_30410 [Kitasatospora sp. Root187]